MGVFGGHPPTSHTQLELEACQLRVPGSLASANGEALALDGGWAKVLCSRWLWGSNSCGTSGIRLWPQSRALAASFSLHGSPAPSAPPEWTCGSLISRSTRNPFVAPTPFSQATSCKAGNHVAPRSLGKPDSPTSSWGCREEEMG